MESDTGEVPMPESIWRLSSNLIYDVFSINTADNPLNNFTIKSP